MTVQSVAFIGLGAMGWHMAGHLTQSFTDVRVYNRTTSKSQDHAKQFATRAVSLADAVQADIIFSCLPTSLEVAQTIQQAPPKHGSIWVDCTSGEPQAAETLAIVLKQHGAYFLDAPVSGQTIGAEKGTLTVMVGGDVAALERARPAIQCFAGLIVHVGSSGAGFAVKAVNNMMLAANLWAAAEGFSVLKAHGVDLNSALTCINASSGRSNASENVMPQRILNRSFPNTFALDLLAKDADIALSLAQTHKIPSPILALTNSLYRAACTSQQTAGTVGDFTSAIQFLEQMTGVTLKS